VGQKTSSYRVLSNILKEKDHVEYLGAHGSCPSKMMCKSVELFHLKYLVLYNTGNFLVISGPFVFLRRIVLHRVVYLQKIKFS